MKFEQQPIDEFSLSAQRVADEIAALLVRKRGSYGPHNLTRFGPLGILVNANNKVERLATLLEAKSDVSPDGDSIEDAWMDLIGYGILGLLYYRMNMKDEACPAEDHASAPSTTSR